MMWVVLCESGKYSEDRVFGPFKTKEYAYQWVSERTPVYSDGTVGSLDGDYGDVRVMKVSLDGPGEG